MDTNTDGQFPANVMPGFHHGQFQAYVMAGFLLGFAIFFGCKNRPNWCGVAAILAFGAFFIGELLSPGTLLWGNVTLEQVLCWVVGLAFFCFAGYMVKKNHVSYGFIAFLVSAFTCFCGLSGVQAFLKTHMLWRVTSSLKSYGDKLDEFETNVIVMQLDLKNQQATNHAQGAELQNVQNSIHVAISQLNSQQKQITTQYNRLFAIDNDVNIAITNLAGQKQQLTNVQSLVDTLYAATVTETLHGTDTNNVVIVQDFGNVKRVAFLLQHPAIPNSIHGVVYGGMLPSASPLLAIHNYLNCFLCNFMILKGESVRDRTYEFQYLQDTRQTNQAHELTVETNGFIVDHTFHIHLQP
jgi:hypothetical protein